MQITIILAILMALLIGDDVTSAWHGSLSPAASLALVAGSILILWSLMRVKVRLLLAKLERLGWPSRAAGRLPGRTDLLMRAFVLGAFALQLTVGSWARVVTVDWQLQHWILADEILLLLPFIVMISLHWYCLYPVNRFVREHLVVEHLAEGLPARPVWSRRQYLLFQLRHGLLIILVPLLLIFAFKDAVEIITEHFFAVPPADPDASQQVISQLVVGAGAGIIFLFAPMILRRVWLTRPLPLGPLRERLEEFCLRIKLRYRDILLWDTYSAIANAAVMGLLGPIRYVLLSDALIENMSDEQIEAVFAHEAGHVHHHHIAFLVMFVAASGSVALLLVELIAQGLSSLAIEEQTVYLDWVMSGLSLLLVIGWILLFGWVSRRFERQADLHGAASVGHHTENNTDVKEPQTNNARKLPHHELTGNRLNARGAQIMATALRRIAFLNGIPVDSRSWRHSSIASRANFLRRLANDDGAMRRFGRIVMLTKIMILLGLLTGIAGWAWLLNTG